MFWFISLSTKKGARSMPGGYVTAGVVGGTSGLVTGGSDLRNRLCMTEAHQSEFSSEHTVVAERWDHIRAWNH